MRLLKIANYEVDSKLAKKMLLSRSLPLISLLNVCVSILYLL